MTTSSPLVATFAADQANQEATLAKELLGDLVQPSQYVGEVISLGYTEALVQIHDFYRQKVGGIPPLAFLIATRVDPGVPIRYQEEDASVILLRVMDAAPLHNEQEAIRTRGETAQRVSGEPAKHWDSPEVMDATTAHLLSFAGISCRVLGTFYLDKRAADGSLLLKFGSDISNYYPNRGLKVYKPNGSSLQRIVNFRPPDAPTGTTVSIGTVRYASTHRSFQGIDQVPVEIVPENLLKQKTAIFGITRIGKSNTTKIILKANFELRFRKTNPRRIGQIVFDINGEYANENVQDKDAGGKNSAIKNVWRTHAAGLQADVVTYGTAPHPNDPGRRLMLINFFRDEHLQTGKELINDALAAESSKYISNFKQVTFGPPPGTPGSAKTRWDRRVLAYRTLLVAGGFDVPSSLSKPYLKGLFGKDLTDALADPHRNEKSERIAEYAAASTILKSESTSWDTLVIALRALQDFIQDPKSAWKDFNNQYMADREKKGKEPEPWNDPEFDKILGMFAYANGARVLGRARPLHTPTTTDDYAASVYEDLKAGRLVIVDQSGGEEAINRSSADRVMEHIFRNNFAEFRAGRTPPHILVYVEEAHNLLPSGKDLDTSNIWVRTAKEGAKSHIGLVYATQEVSSIQKNILANTTNWFVGHLNNEDEMRELRKYHDFDDFGDSILRAQDIGFVRVKTQSNPYIVSTQIHRFEVEAM